MNWQTQHTQQLLENIGWTLIHSLWQISLIALILFFSLRLLKNASANLRYLFSISALSLTIILPVVTFLHSSPSSATKRETISINLDKSAASQVAPVVNKVSKSLNIPNNTAKDKPVNETPLNPTSENIQDKAETLLKNSLPYFVWFWLFGILFFSFRLCGGIWQNHRFKTFKVSVVDKNWQEKFDELCAGIGVSRTVKLIQSNFAQSPMVIGWLKPFVIIPSSVLLGLNPRELETIIVHELIHIRRHDYFINIFQSFVEIILFFHPLLWWISAQVRRERENACDDEVLKFFEGESLTYAQALANLEDLRSQTNFLTPSNILAANGGNLMLRIQRIIKNTTEKKTAKESFLAVIPAFLFISTFLSAVFLTGLQNTINPDISQKSANTKKIAIGLSAGSIVSLAQDLPDDNKETMQLVVEKLKQNKIPTTGFIKGASINVRDKDALAMQEDTVRLWREAGFEIGMLDMKFPQSYNASMYDYHDLIINKKDSVSVVELNKYREISKKRTGTLKKQREMLQKPKNLPAKFLSEEFKKESETLGKLFDKIRADEKKWLKDNNLISVNYTIGGDEWLYSYVYDIVRKRKDERLMSEIRAKYLDYVAEMLKYSEDYSQQLYKREIPQTLSVMPTRLFADSADELIAMYKSHGYQFISIDEAMQDDYKSEVNIDDFRTRMGIDNNKLIRPSVDVESLTLWSENQPKN